MTTYHIEGADTVNDKCHDCGEPATIILVADSAERETGYVDTIPLCDDCKKEYLNRWPMCEGN